MALWPDRFWMKFPSGNIHCLMLSADPEANVYLWPSTWEKGQLETWGHVVGGRRAFVAHSLSGMHHQRPDGLLVVGQSCSGFSCDQIPQPDGGIVAPLKTQEKQTKSLRSRKWATSLLEQPKIVNAFVWNNAFTGDDLRFCCLTSHRGDSVGVTR